MGSLNPAHELTLDFKPTTFIPKTISQFLQQNSTIPTPLSDKILKLDDFVSRLDSEMRKIDAFKRELPLCMLLVNDAIMALKEEIMVLKKTSNNEPVLEQFMPLKKHSDDRDEEFEITKKENVGGDMKNWLSSTQLWNTNDQVTKKRVENEEERMMGDSCKSFGNPARAFIPFNGYCGLSIRDEDKEELQIPALSLITPGIKLLSKTCDNSKLVPSTAQNDQFNIRNGGQSSQQQSSRKQRRCWSTELHRRFVNALQQLGGSQAATPKQIRELMQVDGLTNDEVKSHLQKYRLHTRRLPSSNASSSANQSGLVLGGGLWMSPQDQYVESSKRDISQSNSPDGPLVIGTNGLTSTTGGESMDDGEDAKSENISWKGV